MNLLEEKLHNRIIAKKQELNNHRPLSDKTVRKLVQKMEIEYTYNTNAIEGNTLTHRETQLVIREGITIAGKSLRDHLEAKNHPAAIRFIESLKDQPLSVENIKKVHEIIFYNILESAGLWRKGQVFVEGADFVPIPAPEIAQEMELLVKWLNDNQSELRPIELASVFQHKLVLIHPFEDGNGRVARILMNLLLLKYGYPLTIIRTYDRRRYYNTLKKADNGNLKPFVNFIARCVEESLDIYLSVLEPKAGKRKMMKLSEAAKTTPYTKEYLSLLARKGKIAAVKIGKNWKITPEAIEVYLKSLNSNRSNSRKQSEENGT